jgi:hypothetical protein
MSLSAAPSPAASPPAAEAPGRFRTERVRWSELDFKASKLFLSATTEVELGRVPASQVAAELLPVREIDGLTPAGDSALELTLRSRGMGRDSEIRLWFTEDARALQRTQHENSKKRSRHVVYRFGRQGVERRRWEPETDAETQLPYQRWTDVTETSYPYPAGAVNGLPVIEASMLLWLVSAADLEAPGDRLELLAFSDKRLNRVEIAVEEITTQKVSYEEVTSAGRRNADGPVEVLRLSIRGEPVAAGEEDDFEFLGLSGDLELDLDRATRVPVEISGKVKYAGRVHVKLQRAELSKVELSGVQTDRPGTQPAAPRR